MVQRNRRQAVHAVQIGSARLVRLLLTVSIACCTLATAYADDTPRHAVTSQSTTSEVAALVFPQIESYVPLLDEGTVEWVITFLCEPAHGRPEYQVTMVKRLGAPVEATVIQLVASSLRTQVQSISGAMPNQTSEQVAKEVRRRMWTVSAKDNRKLARLLQAFDRLALPLRRPVGMFIDPTQYRLWSRTASQEVSAILGAASSGETSDPVVKWMQNVAGALGIRSPGTYTRLRTNAGLAVGLSPPQ